LQRQSLFFVYIGIGALVASTFGVGFSMWAAERQGMRIRKAYMRALLQKDVGWHDTNHAAESVPVAVVVVVGGGGGEVEGRCRGARTQPL
jgi:hypothetical protein